MRYDELTAATSAYLVEHRLNRVGPQDAIREDLVGLVLFDAPIFAVGDAEDPLFDALRRPEAVHPDYPLPGEWLAGARRVIVFFAPYTERVRRANAQNFRLPSDEWLHGRIEGEALITQVRLYLRDQLRESGHNAVAPVHEDRFAMLSRYAPNWSERHAGYVCGLGTFGMSKGLITAKGVAGRVGSVITDCDTLPVTPRAYTEVYGYCTACGACAAHCPVRTIDPARGMDKAKDHPPCDAFLAHMREQEPKGLSKRPRYGCGKCQVDVPCEAGIPR